MIISSWTVLLHHVWSQQFLVAQWVLQEAAGYGPSWLDVMSEIMQVCHTLTSRCSNLLQGNHKNPHLFAIPMWEHHTGEYQYNFQESFLDVLTPNWSPPPDWDCNRWCTIIFDSRLYWRYVPSHLSYKCHSRIFQIWSGAHQLVVHLVMYRRV